MGIGDDIEYLAEIKGIISLCDINFELIKFFDSLNELHQRNITTAHDEITSEVLFKFHLLLPTIVSTFNRNIRTDLGTILLFVFQLFLNL